MYVLVMVSGYLVNFCAVINKDREDDPKSVGHSIIQQILTRKTVYFSAVMQDKCLIFAVQILLLQYLCNEFLLCYF